MNKIVVVQHTLALKDYFSTFHDVMSGFSAELILLSAQQIEKLNDYVCLEKNMYIIEYIGQEDVARIIETYFHGVNAEIFLAVDIASLPQDKRVELKKLLVAEKRIQGIINISLEIDFYVPFFRNQSINFQNMGNVVELKRIGQNLNNLVGNTLSELQRIKNLHEQIVPIRSDVIKGLKIYSKYSAGEKSGGDFFDMVEGDSKFILLLISSNSHVILSTVLAHFEALKQQKQDIDVMLIVSFITDVESELKALSLLNDDKNRLNVFIGCFDLRRFTLKGHVFGNYELVSSSRKKYCAGNAHPFGSHFLAKSEIDLSFERGEKIVILSPGIRYNMGTDIMDGKDIVSFIRDMMAHDGRKLLTELFYQLRKDIKGEYLQYDASAIFIEVDQHVIMQV